MERKIKAAIAGATGYTGGELLRILLNHPDVEEFINIKANTDQITSANISVRVNDDFMSAVEYDEEVQVWLMQPDAVEVRLKAAHPCRIE